MNIKQITQKYVNIGYPSNIVSQALEKCPEPFNENLMLDFLNAIQKENQENQLAEDTFLKIAINESIETAKNQSNEERIDPKILKRKNGVPVGLKNLGNTCYFNALLQIYFFNANFLKQILSFQTDLKESSLSNKLIKNLQILFARMIKSDRKYVDPTDVMNSVVNDKGEKLAIGEQKDISEYNLNFLARIEEGLMKNKKKDESAQKTGVRFSFDEKGEESALSQMFFGKMKQTIVYEEKGNLIEKTNIDKFNTIMLQIEHKNLYNSWEAMLCEHLDDFKNDIGEVTNAIRRNTLLRMPAVLFFNLQRVIFNQENGPKKINDRFTFEKELFLDRFLDSNFDKYIKIQEKVTILKGHKKKVEMDLSKVINFEGSQNSVLEIMEQFKSFLQIQKKPDLKNPLFISTPNNSDCSATFNLIHYYENFLKKRIEELQTRLKKIEKDIEECYNEFRKNCRYLLMGIIIHEGEANFGHYFAYIYDFDRKIWRKFSDQYVSEESEEKVMEVAFGNETKSMNAYCLIYMRDSFILSPEKLPLCNFSLSELENQSNDLYSKYLQSTTLTDLVKNENIQFAQEIEQKANEIFLDKVLSLYNSDIKFVMNLLKSYNQEKLILNLKIPNLSSFYIYLRFHPTDSDYTNYIKLHLLDDIVKKNHPEGSNLEEIQDKRLYNTIISEMKKNGLDLTSLNFSKLSSFLDEYLSRISRCALSSYILEKCINEEYREGFSGMKIILSKQQNDVFGRMMGDVLRVTLLRMCSSVAMTARQAKNVQALDELGFILKVAVQFLKKEEMTSIQIQIFAHEIIDRIFNNGGNREKLNVITEGFNNFECINEDWEINGDEMEKLMAAIREKYHPSKLGFNKTDNGITMKLRDQFQRFEGEFWPFSNLYKELCNKKEPILIPDLISNSLL